MVVTTVVAVMKAMETVRADFDPAEEETMALSVAESTEAVQLAEAEVEVLALATTDGLGGRSGSSEVLPSLDHSWTVFLRTFQWCLFGA